MELSVSQPTCTEAIRLRSYLIWERAGCPNGEAVNHWLQAKAEIDAKVEDAYQAYLTKV
jgi:hypothetical protein